MVPVIDIRIGSQASARAFQLTNVDVRLVALKSGSICSGGVSVVAKDSVDRIDTSTGRNVFGGS
jgi:hypothetical protein